jgi:hypothetical protein
MLSKIKVASRKLTCCAKLSRPFRAKTGRREILHSKLSGKIAKAVKKHEKKNKTGAAN